MRKDCQIGELNKEDGGTVKYDYTVNLTSTGTRDRSEFDTENY